MVRSETGHYKLHGPRDLQYDSPEEFTRCVGCGQYLGDDAYTWWFNDHEPMHHACYRRRMDTTELDGYTLLAREEE